MDACALFSPVYNFRIEDLFAFGNQLTVYQSSVEAGTVPGMTCRITQLFDHENDGVVVTVYKDVMYKLDMAGGFSLEPELISGSAPVMGLSRFDGFLP
jgi:hypothetical protein